MKTRTITTLDLFVVLALIAPGGTQPAAVQAQSNDSNIVYVCNTGNIGRTGDISLTGPIWSNITPPNVGTINDCVPDPWSPTTTMWVVGSTGIWKGDNLNTATPLWTVLQTTDQIRSATDGFTQNGSEPDRIVPSASISGTVFVLYSHGGLGSAPNTWVGRSTDNGATWAWTRVANEGEQARDLGFAITQNAVSPDNVTVWASTRRDHLYKSTDGGTSFQRVLALPSTTYYQLHAIYSPPLGNDGSILYVGGGSSSGATSFISRTVDGGLTWATISPVGADSAPRGPLRQYEIAGAAGSASHLYALVQRAQDVVNERKKLYYSSDGGASWSLRQDFASRTDEVLGIGVNATDENRLYVLKDSSSAAATDLIFLSDDGGVTWQDRSGNWRAGVGLWRNAIAVWDASAKPIPLVDLRANYLEVTQAIQNLKNEVRLVENKPTFVRFHVSSSRDSHVTTARLVATNSTGSSVTLLSITNRYAYRYINVHENPARDVLHHAFLFRLPSSHTQGTVTLTAELNPDHAPVEGDYTNNTISTTVTFEPVPQPNVYIFRLGHGPRSNPVYPSMADVEAMVNWIESAYPISELRYTVRKYYHSQSAPDNCLLANEFLLARWWFRPPFTLTRHYGMVATGMRGCAYPNLPGEGGWVASGDTKPTTGAHEVAHMYGRLHPLGCPPEGNLFEEIINGKIYADPDYPYYLDLISDPYTDAATRIYGFDVQNLLINPIIHPFKDSNFSKNSTQPPVDLMSYCPYRKEWISDYTYHGLMDYFQNPPFLLLQAQQSVNATDRLAIHGFADLNANQVELQPIFVIPNIGDLEPRTPGEYAIVLRDALNNELARYPFTPDTGNDGPMVVFTELVPYVTGTVRVDIEEPGGSLLTTISAGAAAPIVNVTAPNGGEVLAGNPVTVSWSASDPDGDPLIFDVHYSPDNGANWHIVAQNITGTTTMIDSDNLSGSTQALFQVWASDGIHTGIDASDAPFTVPNHLPIAEIREPAAPVTIAISQTLGLRAYVYDWDTGSMDTSQIQWRSNIDGLLGTGKQLSVVGLSPGTHTITLEVDDGEGGVITDTVEVTVVADLSQLPPPPDGLLAGPSLIIFEPSVSAITDSIAIDNQNVLNPVAWTAATSEEWVQLSATTGTTPDTIAATFNDTGLSEGLYTATITITSPNVPGESATINVEVIISFNHIYLPIILK